MEKNRVLNNSPSFFIVECGITRFLCTMYVFKVWAYSSSPNFVSFVASIAELPHGEKCVLNHSQSLFDAPGTEAPVVCNTRH